MRTDSQALHNFNALFRKKNISVQCMCRHFRRPMVVPECTVLCKLRSEFYQPRPTLRKVLYTHMTATVSFLFCAPCCHSYCLLINVIYSQELEKYKKKNIKKKLFVDSKCTIYTTYYSYKLKFVIQFNCVVMQRCCASI